MSRRTSRRRNHAFASAIEKLEQRQLLTSIYNIGDVPVFEPTSADLANYKYGPLAKGGQSLSLVYREYRDFVRRGGDPLRFKSDYADDFMIRGRYAAVTLRTRGSFDALQAQVRSYNGQFIYRLKSEKVLQAWVPIGNLHDLAATRDIMHVRLMAAPKTNGISGAVFNQADLAISADQARTTFGVDGTGVTVGVLSDSVGHVQSYDPQAQAVLTELEKAQADGDLPAINILDDSAAFGFLGTDEGRGMLEIIHDVAPGASLAFATGANGQLSFADNIRRLFNDAGATVIVDDVGYADEPVFQEGVISQAINEVVEGGAVYLAAAGNTGLGGYARRAEWVEDNGRYINDWDKRGRVDARLRIRIDAETSFLQLQWDNAYNGVLGAVTADVDMRLLTPTGSIALGADGNPLVGVDDNFATGVPVERIFGILPGVYDLEISVVALAEGAELPTFLRFQNFGSATFDGVNGVEYPGEVAVTAGHSAGQNTLSIGAVPYFGTRANGVANVLSEDFSSSGPVTLAFAPDGTRLDTPLTLLKPDFSGVDAVATAWRGEFFGTSAASPNVAAIVALMRQANPAAGVDDIKSALISAAKKQPLNGTAAGKWDPQGGWGLVDASFALQKISPAFPVGQIAEFRENPQVGWKGDVFIHFSEPVQNIDLSDFVIIGGFSFLDQNGIFVDLASGEYLDDFALPFPAEAALYPLDGGMTWGIQGLRSRLNTPGTYLIKLAEGHDIQDSDGNLASVPPTAVTILRRNPRPPAEVSAFGTGQGQITINWTAVAGDVKRYRVERSAVPDFSSAIDLIPVSKNTTRYVDTTATGDQPWYYRIRMIDVDDRLSPPSQIVSAIPLQRGEVVVDNEDATVDGAPGLVAGPSLVGVNQLQLAGGAASSATFAPVAGDLLATDYYVYARWDAVAGAATNAAFEIYSGSTLLSTVTVDQSARAGGWVLLGKFANSAASLLSLRIGAASANGTVAVDAVRFQPSDANAPAIA